MGALPAAGAMESILDFSRDLDIAALDRVVQTFYSGSGQTQQDAQKALTQFQEHPDAWTRVDGILEKSSVLQTKFLALQILENLIKTKWKITPADQKQGIKNYIVAVIIRTSSDDDSLKRERMYLSKLNIVLVQILKQEWPHDWPSFIPEIVASSKTNLALCENNMAILKLLSEEIFDFSAESLTSTKQKTLKTQMCSEFSEVFQLCHEILDKASKTSLIKATLETMLRFLSWVPLGYIFETNLIDILITRFLPELPFRNVTLQCLTEIGSLQVEAIEYREKFVKLFTSVVEYVHGSIPLTTNFNEAYEDGSDEEQKYIQNLGNFLVGFLSQHLTKTLEQYPTTKDLIQVAHHYLLKVSTVRDREIFKTCLEYWFKFTQELYGGTADQGILQLNALNSAQRRSFYADICSTLRVVMIEAMVKPEEVLVVENDEGEIVRETLKESDTLVLGKSMKEVMVYLCHLDPKDMENIMTQKLMTQTDERYWAWDTLNRLCWSIGNISGAMSDEDEKKFLVNVIKELLTLCEQKKGKDNKAVVASNIMYIVGQYPRFLKQHWKFLKTVVNKLFEFMHESHEGVQDMACDTFIKIAQKCKKQFVMQHPNEIMPYIDEILATINETTSDLTPQQVQTFYEAVGHMVSAETRKPHQDRLIGVLMSSPNAAWDGFIASCRQDANVLDDPANIKLVSNILKTNVSACSSIGSSFVTQISRIFNDMMILYTTVSQTIGQAIELQGPIATKTPKVRAYRTVKKEVLKLIDAYVRSTDAMAASQFFDTMLTPLLEAILVDYRNAKVPGAREAEVLNVMATIVEKYGANMNQHIPSVLDSVFESTLGMITKDFEEFPEHRLGFYKLLREINAHCSEVILGLPGHLFKLFYDSIVWAFKHTMRDIADIGLNITLELLSKFETMDSVVSNAFFKSYLVNILQDIFYVLTDTSHKSGFKLQTLILAKLFSFVERGAITVPIFDNQGQVSNSVMLKEHLTQLLCTAFPNLSQMSVKTFVDKLGVLATDPDHNAFKTHLRDFLINLKQFEGDNSDLYLDEREAEAQRKKQIEFEQALKIPGMVKPSERPDDGMMD